MDIALVENNYVLPTVIYEHDWIHILYMGISTVFFIIQVCQRITIDLFYTSSKYSCSESTSLNVYLFIQKISKLVLIFYLLIDIRLN